MAASGKMNKKYGLVIVLCSLSLLSSCSDMCGNKQVAKSESPDGKQKFVVFTRSCGETTSFSTQASILPIHQPLLNEGGNLLAMDGKFNVLGVWQSANQLLISGVGSAQISKQESVVSGVAVTYED